MLLIPILAIGFILRIVGIGVGLPDYPDSREPLIAQDILNLIHLKAVPEIYNWPGTAWFYLIAAMGKILEVCGFVLTVPHVIWLARFTNALLSTGTLWLTYQIGVRFYSRFVGCIGAGFLALAMLHATNESRFALVDIPATFCVTLLLWFCAKDQATSFRRAIWLGVLAGIGFAVKYTTVFAGLSVIAFFFIHRTEGWGRTLLKLATVLGVGAISFTLICPYWLIDLFSPEWNQFFDALFYEVSHYRRGHFGLFATGEVTWANRLTYLWILLRWGMGWPLALLAFIGILIGMIERRDGDNILLAFVLSYLLFIALHKLKFARHLLLVYPALTVFAAASIGKGRKGRKGKDGRTEMEGWKVGRLEDCLFPSLHPSILPFSHLISRFTFHVSRFTSSCLLVSFLGGVGAYSLIYTAAFAGVLTTPPTPIETAEWIAFNIPPDEAVAHEPEILFDWLLPKLDREYDGEDARWVVVLMPNAEIFLNYMEKPDSYSAIDWYPMEIHPETTVPFYKRIFGDASRYELAHVFQRHPRFLGISISDQGAPFPMRALAHPEIRVYRLREF